MHKLGASHDGLEQEATRFKEFKLQSVAKKAKIPQGDGVLILQVDVELS